jgi:hypothetical protein
MISRIPRAAKRYWVREVLNRRIDKIAAAVKEHETETNQKPVIFFNASTRLSGMSLNAAYALLSSWSLRLSGTPVVHFVCNAGMTRCHLGTNKDDVYQAPPCNECIAQSKRFFKDADARWFIYNRDEVLAGAIECLSISGLSDFQYNGLPLGKLIMPSIRWVLRRHHLNDDEATKSLYREYILSAYALAEQFKTVLDDVNPQALIVFNGLSFPEAVARHLAEQRGIRVITHEISLRPSTAFFTEGDATAYPIDIPEDFELSEEENAEFDEYLSQRFKGNFTTAGVRFWPEMTRLSSEILAKLDNFEQVVPVFTNVIFDTSQDHANVVFPHMFAWLDEVVEIATQSPNTLFVIRAHPDEIRPGKASRESVADWAKSKCVDDLPNVLFVAASKPFSSYELIQRSKFVMIYNSTIGLEAAILGMPVLCAGKSRFTQLPTVYFPESQDAYREKAFEFLNARQVVQPEAFQKNAKNFLFYQLYRTALPFEDFIEPDGVWQGYVTLKPFNWEALLPENSETMRIIQNGILKKEPFIIQK